jgi:hypothetical protein
LVAGRDAAVKVAIPPLDPRRKAVGWLEALVPVPTTAHAVVDAQATWVTVDRVPLETERVAAVNVSAVDPLVWTPVDVRTRGVDPLAPRMRHVVVDGQSTWPIEVTVGRLSFTKAPAAGGLARSTGPEPVEVVMRHRPDDGQITLPNPVGVVPVGKVS